MPRILPGGYFGKGWMSPPPRWSYMVTSTAALLAHFTTDYVHPDAILLMLLETVQEAHSAALYAEISRRVAARGAPREIILLWTWCAASGGDLLSQRRIAKELMAEAASPEGRITPDRSAAPAAEWVSLDGGCPCSEMSPLALPETDPFPEPTFSPAAVAPSSPHLI